jgi:tetratricopeptide (TPR) repeat protein
MLAIVLALAGCNSVDPSPAPPWRVEGLWRVDDGVTGGTGPGYYALGRAYEGEGRWEQAANAYRKAVRAEPANAEYCNALGLALARGGQLGVAIFVFERAMSLAPQRADLLNNLGYALMLDGQDERAQTLLNAALQRDPLHAQARANLDALEARLASQHSPSSPTASSGDPAPATSSVADAPPPALELRTAPTAAALSVSTADSEPPLPAAAVAAPPLAGQADAPLRARVEIVNGNGVRGAAAKLRAQLGDGSAAAARLSNRPPYKIRMTTIEFRPGFADQALAIAQRMPLGPQLLPSEALGTRTDVRVLLGHDLKTAEAGGIATAPAVERTSAWSRPPSR